MVVGGHVVSVILAPKKADKYKQKDLPYECVYRKNKAHFKKNLKPLAPSKRGTGGMSKQLIVQKMFFLIGILY